MTAVVEPVDVVLVAVGGYGQTYLRAMLDDAASYGARLVAVVDPFAEKADRIDEVRSRGIPVYEFLADCFLKHTAELVVISSPIHLHCEQIRQAVAAGAHVLCEKPVSGSCEEGLQALAAARAAGRFVAIGYQWSFSDAIHRLKQDVSTGRFGAPQRFRSLVLWPRPSSYYARNGWAGRKYAEDGAAVFDSPANNACAHFLHNMFYVLGDSREMSALPASVEAELYRAKPIENFDTAVIRCVTTSGVEVLCYASHSTETLHGPMFSLECERATVVRGPEYGDGIVAELTDGTTVSYGAPDAGKKVGKLLQCINAVRSGTPVACPLSAALPQTVVVLAADESQPVITDFPASLVGTAETDEGPLIFVRGLGKALESCFERGILPSEDAGLEWAKPGKVIDTTGRLPSV